MIRCHAIGNIMTNPRTKGADWSETAKSAMLELAREQIFGVRKSLDDVRCIQKGLACEDEAIELYNNVFLCDLKKVENDERRNNGIITGVPDLVAASEGKGVDIKVAWSLLTFPLTSDQADKKAYEWQARGYMALFDLPVWEIAYCAIDTPTDILPNWEDEKIHLIPESIPNHCRITICRYERDMAIEKLMLDKCEKANAFVKQAMNDFITDHEQYLK